MKILICQCDQDTLCTPVTRNTVKSQMKVHSHIGLPEYRPTMVLMQNLSRF